MTNTSEYNHKYYINITKVKRLERSVGRRKYVKISEHKFFNGTEYKLCVRCNTPKILSEFNKNCTRHDGLADYCRKCSHQLSAQWRDKRKKS